MPKSSSSPPKSEVTATAPPSRDFNPPDVTRHGAAAGIGDERSGALYVYSDTIKLAVRVALVTGRPLLVRGAPGWGKSSLAHAAANHLGWRYLEKVISSRTQARDLMSELDLVRRLSDAQRRGRDGDEGGVDSDWRRYIRPGVLWEAFDPVSAQQQRDFFDRREAAAAADPQAHKPAVVLLDEMDKAEPDVPNNLLVALGSLQFAVDEIAEQREGKRGPLTVKAQAGREPLIIVTTNDERDLPRAFLRRCVEIELPVLNSEDREKFTEKDRNKERIELLMKIGTEHLSQVEDKDGKPLGAAFVRKIADVIAEQIEKGRPEDATVPSPAEFVDTARAVGKLYGADVTAEQIGTILGIAVRKRGVPVT